jgi:hypothetical protein
MLSRFTTSSFRAARPQPPPALLQNANVNVLAKKPMSISSPKCQSQSPRQNAHVNLLAKLPMSIPSPKCTTQEPLTPSPSCRPLADSLTAWVSARSSRGSPRCALTLTMNVRAPQSTLSLTRSMIVFFMVSAFASPASVVRGPLPIHLDTLSRVVSLSHK